MTRRIPAVSTIDIKNWKMISIFLNKLPFTPLVTCPEMISTGLNVETYNAGYIPETIAIRIVPKMSISIIKGLDKYPILRLYPISPLNKGLKISTMIRATNKAIKQVKNVSDSN